MTHNWAFFLMAGAIFFMVGFVAALNTPEPMQQTTFWLKQDRMQ